MVGVVGGVGVVGVVGGVGGVGVVCCPETVKSHCLECFKLVARIICSTSEKI